MRVTYFFILIMVIAFGGTFLTKAKLVLSEFKVPASQFGLVYESQKNSALFTGDIMLGRSVESVMEEKGESFPFVNIAPLLGESDLVVGNFEGAVPLIHEKTPSNSLKLSMQEENLVELRQLGFDVLSLANNHSLDFGTEGYLHTLDACTRANILCIGNPKSPAEDSISIQTVGETKIGIIALHTLFEAPSTTTLESILLKLSESTDVQVAYIHWGEEYKALHSSDQENLAHFLIDHGVDVVIGHHPHVIQDIELYAGKPIFYSLGNLIFDQYFGKEVQEGYMVEATFKNESVTYTLLPYDSHDVRSQPKLQTGDEKAKSLRSLLRYPLFTKKEIESGSFEVLAD